jgi:nicotinamidase/pyrazinamidase
MQDPVTMETIPTDLAETLWDQNIERIVVVGLATDYCVKATALDGVANGFQVEVLTEAIRAVNLQEGDGDLALEEMAAAQVNLL